MSRFVIGDIHGMYDKMRKVLELSQFDPAKDILYSTGDFCDRGTQNVKTLKYLLSLKDSFKPVFGNHDVWSYLYFNEDHTRDSWEVWDFNGGRRSYSEFNKLTSKERQEFLDFYTNLPYRIELDDFIIQHTPNSYEQSLFGQKSNLNNISLKYVIDQNICSRDYDRMFWDRDVVYSSKEIYGEHASHVMENFNRIYKPTEKTLIVGHTVTMTKMSTKAEPKIDRSSNFICIDTGSFIDKQRDGTLINGEITVLNLDTLDWVNSNNDRGSFRVIS